MSAPGEGLVPAWMQEEIGHALWWLTRPEATRPTPSEAVQRILARGNVHNIQEARQVVREAQKDITATRRIHSASTGQSLRSACDYKCPDDTPIALRIRVQVMDARGVLLGDRSLVINARASDNLQNVLDRATQVMNTRFPLGSETPGARMPLQQVLTVADIDQVLLNYTQGSVWA